MTTFLASSTRGAQLFLLFNVLVTAFGVLVYDITWSTFGLFLLGYFFYGCLGIVVTFHRLLTHGSYQVHPVIEKMFSIFGCLGGTGSSLAWVAIHINHHLKSDKINDPHSPLHKGWRIFFLNYENDVDVNTKWRMKRLVTDKFHQLLHRYYFAIIIVWDIILFVLGGLYLVIFLHLAPAAFTAIMSNIVNYVGHKPDWPGAYRRYGLADQSTNNWILSIPSWGETWHNNHHRHPRNYQCGERWWEIDISAMVIKLIKK